MGHKSTQKLLAARAACLIRKFQNAQRKLTKVFAEVDGGTEGPDGEVNAAVDNPEVRQLDAQGLVHGRE